MKTVIVLLAAVLIPFGVQAETSLKIGGLSSHLFTTHHTNSFHRIINPRYKSYSLAYARNSFDKDIFTASYIKSYEYNYITLNVHFGAVYGYSACKQEDDNGDRVVCPLIAPEIEIKAPLQPTFSLFGDAIVFTVDLL